MKTATKYPKIHLDFPLIFSVSSSNTNIEKSTLAINNNICTIVYSDFQYGVLAGFKNITNNTNKNNDINGTNIYTNLLS